MEEIDTEKIETAKAGEEGAEEAEEETPEAQEIPWYEPIDAFEAFVDCSDYGWGRFRLGEPLMKQVAKGESAKAKSATNDAGTKQLNEIVATEVRVYVKALVMDPDGRGCERVSGPLPADTAKFEEWVKFVQSMPHKAFARLRTGINLFQRDYGVELGKN